MLRLLRLIKYKKLELGQNNSKNSIPTKDNKDFISGANFSYFSHIPNKSWITLLFDISS